MALTDDQQHTLYYRALEEGARLAGAKIRTGVQDNPTVELENHPDVIVTATATADDFMGEMGLFNAFQVGLQGG